MLNIKYLTSQLHHLQKLDTGMAIVIQFSDSNNKEWVLAIRKVDNKNNLNIHVLEQETFYEMQESKTLTMQDLKSYPHA